MSSNSHQFNLNCTSFTMEELKLLNLTRAVTAMTCTLLLSFILFLVLCHKALSSIFQRLYIYLLIVTLLIEIFISLSVERQFQYTGQDKVCVFLGFTTQWLSVIQMIYTFEIIAYLFCIVVFAIRQENCFPQHLQHSRACRRLTEALLAILPIIAAFVYSWEPYVRGNHYGLAGAFCWIRSMDEVCRDVGTIDQMIYYGLYELLGIIGVVVQIIFAVVYCRLSSSMKEARYLLRQTLIVMIFKFVYTLTITFQLGVRLYTGLSKHQSYYAMWMTFSFVSPFRQLLFPVGCLVCFYPVKVMFMDSLCRKMWRTCCNRISSSNSSSYEVVGNPNVTFARRATVPESTRISQPSYTYFIVPHPDLIGEASHLVSQE